MYLLTIGADTFTSPGRSWPSRAHTAHTEPNIHSTGKRTKNFFLAHFHVLRKSSDTKMREKIMPNFLPRAYFPVTCALVPGSHTDTGRVRVSSVSCPAHRTGKLILGLGSSCPNLFLGDVFARLESSSTPFSIFTQPPPRHWDGNEGFLSTFSPGCLHQACWRCQGFEWIIPYIEGGESFREWQCIVYHEQELRVQPEGGARAAAILASQDWHVLLSSY